NGSPLSEHRRTEKCACSRLTLLELAIGKFGFRCFQKIVNMYGLSVMKRSATRNSQACGPKLRGWEESPEGCHYCVSVTLNESNLRVRRLAQPSGILCNHVQHGLNVGRRAGDNAENL